MKSISSDYVRVYYTFVPSEIINAKMILDKEGIEYITSNENFAALYPGADGMATVDFLVKEKDEERAKEVLRDLIQGKR
ncbi:MAG TPA: DUF2007 domain-containing protein [Candidatus Acidoferrales bacterium]|nr:DUF2007 domain-containing protein [Candidatus Acidoferrales bacterium]